MSELTTEVTVLIKSFCEVYLNLLPGYKENIYQQALSTEFTLHNIPHALEVVVPINYKGYYVGFERADIVLYNSGRPCCVLELKAQNQGLNKKEFNQLSKYLFNLNLNLGYIINFYNTPVQVTQNNVLEYLEICKIENSVLYKFNALTKVFEEYKVEFNNNFGQLNHL